MRWRATLSSMMVSIATQPSSDKLEMVGRRRDGSFSTTSCKDFSGRFILSPTFPRASRAALSMRTMRSIFARFQSSA